MGGKWVGGEFVYVSDEKAEQLGQNIARPHDLVFTQRGTLGQVSIVPANGYDRYVVSQSQMKITVDPTKADVNFLYYLFNLPDQLQYIQNSAIQTGVPHTNLGILKKTPVTIPSLAVQKQVASVLTSFDDRIDLLRETNATLEAIAQALFKSWFVDFDPVRAKQEGRAPEGMDEVVAALFPDVLEESKLGLVPKGWQISPIGTVVEGIYDGPHATPPEATDGPIFLGIKNLTGIGLDLANIRHISENDYGQWTRRVIPQKGDIVFSYEATLGFFAIIPESIRCCLGRRLALIRPRVVDGHGHFWFHQLVGPNFQRLLEKHTIHGATVNRIALKEFPSYLVLDPPKEIKTAFQNLTEALWQMIHVNQDKMRTLSDLRDILLPRLISGQFRLSESTSKIEELAHAV